MVQGSHLCPHADKTEKKLQLIRSMREDHIRNQRTIRNREAILLGEEMPLAVGGDCGEVWQTQVGDEKAQRGVRQSFLGVKFRLFVCVACLGLFVVWSRQERLLAGVCAQDVRECVMKDYSGELSTWVEEAKGSVGWGN